MPLSHVSQSPIQMPSEPGSITWRVLYLQLHLMPLPAPLLGMWTPPTPRMVRPRHLRDAVALNGTKQWDKHAIKDPITNAKPQSGCSRDHE